MSRLVFVTMAALGSLMAFATSASAHITLENPQGAIGAGYKAVFRVPHGCKGSATVALKVQVPDGVIAVKPQPKAGWQIKTVKGKYDKAYTFDGAKLEEGVREVDWSGGKLPDDYYDEFVFSGFLTDSLKPGTTLYFPVVQECERGVERWIEIPAEGKTSDDYETPAPGLKLIPNQGSDD
jgi:periplasmic copper chaperone A